MHPYRPESLIGRLGRPFVCWRQRDFARELGLSALETKKVDRWSLCLAAAGLACTLAASNAAGQSCTTQSKLAPALRDTLAQTALELASAVKAGDAAAVKAGTVASLAANFAGTEGLVRTTAGQLSGDTLQVTQLYVLDATSRTSSEGNADFTCSLADAAASETDFSINGLPPGRFAFAMVEAARGPHPWLLAFLLQQEGGETGKWKLAGFYPRARTAGGHDGLWYWKDARARVTAKEPWLAWLEFGEASSLLQPVNFMSSTHLEALHAEQHAAAPPGLTEGLSTDSPLELKSPEGGMFRITQMSAEPTDGDGPLRLQLHIAGSPNPAPGAMRQRGIEATGILLAEHPELRSAFANVLVFVDVPGGSPEVLSLPMTALK